MKSEETPARLVGIGTTTPMPSGPATPQSIAKRNLEQKAESKESPLLRLVNEFVFDDQDDE